MSYICVKTTGMTSQTQATFICRHCKRICLKNVRLKGHQRYCASKPCQQARKNKWERDRLKRDSTYRLKRSSNKKEWYSKYPGDQYQSSYRSSHPDYVSGNREKQRLRASKNTQKHSEVEKQIVKTDALSSENLVSKGFYVLIPYKKTNPEDAIVKTDAYIIELLGNQGLQTIFSARSP
jgi:hypothetical protein